MATDSETDGGLPPGLERDELYDLVRLAVKDAMFDVLGTLVLLGVALVILAAAVRSLLVASTALEAAFVLGLALLGLWMAGGAFDLVPPFRN